MSAYHDITTNKGSAFYYHFKLTDQNNNPLNLATSNTKLSIKKSPLGNDTILDFSLSGVTVSYYGPTGQTFSLFSPTGGIDVNASYLGISGDTGGIYVFAPAEIMEKAEIGNWVYSMNIQYGESQFNPYNIDFDPNIAVYGEEKAASFMRSVKNGEDCLDVVLIGDSNTGFNQHGWHEGIANACIDNQGMQVYATPLAPFVGPTLNSFGQIGYRTNFDVAPIRSSTVDVDKGLAYSVLQNSLVTFGALYDGFLRGNTDSNCAALREKFNPGVCSGDGVDTADFLSNNAFWGFGFTDSSTSLNNVYYSHVHGGITILDTHPFRGITFTYRVVHSKGNGGGQMTMNIRRDSSPTIDIVSPLAVNTNNEQSWDWHVSELTNNVLGTTGPIRCSSFGLNFGLELPGRGVTGNVGFLFHSVYRKTKGIAFNNLVYMGGRRSDHIAKVMDKTPIDTLVTYLKELRSRQQAAGGTGKIIFFVQFGTNDVGISPQTADENFLENIRSIIRRLDVACYAASIDKNDFAFIFMVSHPMSVTDTGVGASINNNLTIYREIVAERSSSNEETLPVTFVNLLAMKGTYNSTFDRLDNQSFYSGSDESARVHLNPSGYDELGISIAQNLLNYESPDRPPDYTINVGDGNKQNVINGRFIVDWNVAS